MKSNYAMWSERHRPTNLDECVLEALPPSQEAFIRALGHESELPNLLFYGPPGTGKTTVARIICEGDRYSVHRFNGSLLGKAGVSELQRYALGGTMLFGEQRIMLIDEVDGITEPGQLALRALMEDPRANTGWVLTCNFRQNLIDPMRSRLVEIEFNYPPREHRQRHLDGLLRRCRKILDAEGITTVTDDEIRKVINCQYPDLRKIITTLQLEFSYRRAA